MYKAKDKHVYGWNKKIEFDSILTEDSKAGFEFYNHYFMNTDIECISAGNNSGIFKAIQNNQEKHFLIFADGAAFGSEIDRIMKLQLAGYSFILCLPESFEWLILKSGVLNNKEIEEILNNTSDYVESSIYFSWEQFFSSELKRVTIGTPFKYEKEVLSPAYLNLHNMKKILEETPISS